MWIGHGKEIWKLMFWVLALGSLHGALQAVHHTADRFICLSKEDFSTHFWFEIQ